MSSNVDEYTEAAIQRLLTEHPSLGEQGITLSRREHCLVLSGEVESPHRRDELEKLVRAALPGVEVCCDIGITRAGAPTEHEDLS